MEKRLKLLRTGSRGRVSEQGVESSCFLKPRNKLNTPKYQLLKIAYSETIK